MRAFSLLLFYGVGLMLIASMASASSAAAPVAGPAIQPPQRALAMAGAADTQIYKALGDSQYFPQTGHTVEGRFFNYWLTQGALPQFGYPLSDELLETSATDGKQYTVQYFERAVFEMHPENQQPYDVLLQLLGSQRYLEYYGPDGASNQHAGTDNPLYFPQTKHAVGGVFRQYWEQHGGVAVQGYPISDEFQEQSSVDGKTYTVQYFERAEFELHPENQQPYDVLLTQLGAYQYQAMHTQLSLPPPVAPDLHQVSPKGSNDYLVWSETRLSGDSWPPFLDYGTVIALRALNLHTGRTTIVADTPGVGGSWAVSGSIVVYQAQNQACTGCTADTLAKDLRTGTTYTVITGTDTEPEYTLALDLAGTTAVWVQRIGDIESVVTKDVAAQTTETLTLASEPIRFSPANKGLADYQSPGVSDQYIVWVESRFDTGGSFCDIQAYNRETHQIHTVVRTPHAQTCVSAIALSSHYLVWSSPALHIVDLDTGQTTFVSEQTAYSPMFRGNTLLWISAVDLGTGRYTDSIWRWRFSNRTPLPLTSALSISRLVIAGDWLAWQQGRSGITIAPLVQLFVNNTSPLQPTASPTPAASP